MNTRRKKNVNDDRDTSFKGGLMEELRLSAISPKSSLGGDGPLGRLRDHRNLAQSRRMNALDEPDEEGFD
jgi:hypothetical protein